MNDLLYKVQDPKMSRFGWERGCGWVGGTAVTKVALGSNPVNRTFEHPHVIETHLASARCKEV